MNSFVKPEFEPRIAADVQLDLAIQPLMDIRPSVPKVFAHEALLRIGTPWCSRKLEAFIQEHERLNTIADIDRWVATRACTALKENPGMRLTINASQKSVSDVGYVSHVAKLVKAARCPGRLVVEVTETAKVHDDNIDPGLIALHKASVGIMIDDIYDGFAKRHLLSLPHIAGCKISRHTTTLMMSEAEHAGEWGHIFTEVKALVDRCRMEGKALVMEGIESTDEFAMAKRLGVSLCQGFYFSHPTPLAPSIYKTDAKVAVEPV